MKYSSRIKPISYVKANAAEVIRELAERREPLVITQNGEATAVMQDVASYEATQETLALLKILALGRRQIEDGKAIALAEATRRPRARRIRSWLPSRRSHGLRTGARIQGSCLRSGFARTARPSSSRIAFSTAS